MKDMLYDFIAIAVVVGLIVVFVIGGENSVESNLTDVAQANTTRISDVIE